MILAPVLAELKQALGDAHQDVLELESILTAISHLPGHTETDEARIRERQREKEVIKRRLSVYWKRVPIVQSAFTEALTQINGKQGDPRSFDRLERLLAEQAYRLSFWRVAADEINYRRFFDINELAAIRVEDPEVFTEVHALVFDLIRLGQVSGFAWTIRTACIEPERYFRDLQRGCRSAREDPRAIIRTGPFLSWRKKFSLATKRLRPGWEIEGTTGYDFLNTLNGLFVDRSNDARLRTCTADSPGGRSPMKAWCLKTARD